MFPNLVAYSANLIFLVGQAESVSIGNAAIRVLGVSFLIAIFGFGAAIWLRRRNYQVGNNVDKTQIRSLLKGELFKKVAGDLTIVSSKKIAPGQTLIDVDWLGRRILLGCTTHGISVLSEDDSKAEFPPESEK